MALLSYSHLKEVVDFVKKMSFDPFRSQFVVAISITIMLLTQNFKWDNKFDIYKRWGWSEEEILTAFGKHPLCMMTSNNKIMAVMDFLVNNMGWEPCTIAQRPILFSFSMEKRIIRCASVL